MGIANIFKNNDKYLKEARRQADKVETLKPAFEALTDTELRAKTAEFKERAANGESLESLLPEVFAQVREGAKRVLGMEHFYVQLLGGVVLHQGNIAEMKTGEGKTLVATLPACLNALTGQGVHIVTVNDYLATRDSEWMGKLYKFLGFSVGLVVKDMDPEEKKAAYNCDILYGTNNELGFDYLRDNMVVRREQIVQRKLHYAIVDEVDSILIDEARTPLIISGAGDKGTEMYERADRFVMRLKNEEDFTMDEKQRTINLTEDGVHKAELHFNVTNLSDIENTELNHHINQALKARNLMRRDIDYVVQNGEVVIVDEFTGRLMTGRRYSDGLHQAIEAKENVKVERESKTLATITFQNYFRMYEKLSGMTGTAKTEEDEFNGIYNLAVVQIPTHMPMIRKDLNDVIYPTINGKFNAVVDEICEVHKTGQPILVGTVSVEKSEILSNLLKRRGVNHEVLNAKHHQKEAQIIAQAGKFGVVTIATNMAGRGTDILLGGNPDFMARSEMKRLNYDEQLISDATSHAETDDEDILEARGKYNELYEKYKAQTDAEHEKVIGVGGLYIIGTERHESRRIDNQLRGRSGRQGDPGQSRFYIALEDDLMRLFGGERIKNMMARLNTGEEVPLEYGMMTRQIENAQKRIEERNYDTRKYVLEYDDVMNKQRMIIYDQRRRVLMGEDIHSIIMDMLTSIIDDGAQMYCPKDMFPEEWDFESLEKFYTDVFLPKDDHPFDDMEKHKLNMDILKEMISSRALELYGQKEELFAKAGIDMREAERVVLLRVVDDKWMTHIDDMDQLKQGIGLRAYGQRDPIVAYRMEGYDMFDEMVKNIRYETVKMLYHVNIESKIERKPEAPANLQASHGESGERKPVKNKEKKIGRNEPCPCGSGKKYKNCCGA